MTKYEFLMQKVALLEKAMHQAACEKMKNVWFSQSEKLKYKIHQMTIREAKELI